MHIVEFYGKKIDSTQYIAIRHEWKDITPKSGWSKFFDEINQRQIVILQSGKPPEEMGDYVTHPFYVQFEIAQGEQYRYYKYSTPFFYRYVDPGANQINEFLKFINSETGLPVYRPTEHLYQQPNHQ